MQTRRGFVFPIWMLIFLVTMQSIALPVWATGNTGAKTPVRKKAAKTKRPQDEAKPTPVIVSVEPTRFVQGQKVSVSIRGQKTKWKKDQTRVSFGPEISVGGAPAGEPGPAQVVNKKFILAQIEVLATAALGPRGVRIVTGTDALETTVSVNSITPPGDATAIVSTLAGEAGKEGFVDGDAKTARLKNPAGVAVGSDEAVYIADAGNHAVRRVDTLGNVTTLAGTGTAGFADGPGKTAQFRNPQGVAVDAGGFVFVADTDNHRIRRIAPDGTVSTVAGTGTPGLKDGAGVTAQFNFPRGVAVEGGSLYVADSGNEAVRRIDPNGTVSTVASDLKGLAAVATDGKQVYVYLADTGRIRRLGADGALITIAGAERGFSDGTGASSRFAEPSGLAVDADGTLIVADTVNSLVRSVVPDAAVRGDAQAVTTLAGTGEPGAQDGPGSTARFSSPRGVAVLSSSVIVVADGGNHILRRLEQPPAVVALEPARAEYGETIYIKGRRFDGRGPAFNAVDFAREGGERTPAQVLSATRTELRVIVPDDAVRGRLRVRTVLGGAESREDFDVAFPAGPFVKDFRPRFGVPGTVVTLTGFNLSNEGRNQTRRQGDKETRRQKAPENVLLSPTVTFSGAKDGRVAAAVKRASATELQVVVPDGAQTGQIEVSLGSLAGRTKDVFSVDQGGYELVLAPSRAETVERGKAVYSVFVSARQEHFTHLVKLSVEGLPVGATGRFDREYITAGAMATLTVSLRASSAPAGSYDLTIRGTAPLGAGNVERTTKVTLSVRQPGETLLSGRVLSTENDPLPNVVVSLDGRSATTDGAGMFLLGGIEAGVDRPVMVDGRTAATPNASYPVIIEPATVVVNRMNEVPYTFYLPKLDIENEVAVNPGKETVVTTPRIPGYKLVIPAGTMLKTRDGSAVTHVSITPVPPDRTPAPLPANVRMAMAYTAQPGGAETSGGPLVVTYPNLTGASPGAKQELWNYDHDRAQWYVYGTGTVSADGSVVEPDVDPATGKPYGLPYFSWHGTLTGDGGDPGPDGDNPEDDAPDDGGGSGGGGGGGDDSCPSNRGPNTVDFSTGTKVEQTTDIVFGGSRGGLRFGRVYTSNLVQQPELNLPFGAGTTHNFDIRINRGRGAEFGAASVRLVMPEHVTGFLFSRVGFDQSDGSLVYRSTARAELLGAELKHHQNRTWEYRSKDGRVLRFGPDGVLTQLASRNGNTITLLYDGGEFGRGRLKEIRDAVGRSIKLEYDGAQRIVKATDPLGRVWEYAYGGTQSLLLAQVKDPMGRLWKYGYGSRGTLETVTDPRGVMVKQIKYDQNRRVIEQRFADGGTERYEYVVAGGFVAETTVTDPEGRTRKYRFNAAGYVIEVTDELGQVSRIERAAVTNVKLSQIGPCGCSEDERETDQRGNVTARTDRLGHTSRYEYDPKFNRVTKITDKLGHVTRFEYDDKGNLTKIINALGEETKFEYNQLGQRTAVIDALGHATRTEYNAQGHVTAQIDALGNRATYEYNALGWLTAATDPLGRRIEITYDLFGRISTRKDPASALVAYNYDESDNLITMTDALGRICRMQYDAKNRRISYHDPLGRITQMDYDTTDKLVMIVSPSGRSTHYAYDQRGRRVFVTDPMGRQIRFEYDYQGNSIQLTDQRSNTTGFRYDELNRPIGIRDPLGRETQIEYDIEGNTSAIIDRLGRRTMVAYDALNRLTQITYPDATVTYRYDVAGRMVEVMDSQDSSIIWNYDEANRLISESTSLGTIEYEYNASDQRLRLNVPGQTPVNYSYDVAGRLQNIIQGTDVFTYTYDIVSRLRGLRRSNGVSTIYTYDDVDRLTHIQHANLQNQAIEDFQFNFSIDDEITAQTSLFSSTIPAIEKNIAPSDPTNRTRQFGSTIYEFDKIGQPLTKADADGITRYTWDARGRLTKVVLPNNEVIAYAYDALNRRISRTVNTTIEQFVYDGQDIVTDLGNTRTDYLNGLGVDQKLRQSDSRRSNFFLQDQLGSTIGLTDSDGNVVERISYETFGKSSGSQFTRYLYTNREEDSLTGLIYYRARWYDPIQRKFLTEDSSINKNSVRLENNLNLYTYVENNPLNFTDPSGLQRTPFSLLGLVVSLSQTALQKQSCRNLFSCNVDPSVLLGNIINGSLGSLTFANLGASSLSAETKGILGSEVVTRPDGTTYKRSKFTGANITINSNLQAPFFNGYGNRFGANDMTNRGITLIHELGHAANIIFGQGSSQILDDAGNATQSAANSKLVFDNCFK